MAIAYSATCRLAPALSDLYLNAVYRGVFGTPPTYYIGLGVGATIDTAVEIASIRAPVAAGDVFMGTTSYDYMKVVEEVPSIYIAAAGTHTVRWTMAFDAPTGGNLLYVTEAHSTGLIYTQYDVIDLSRGDYHHLPALDVDNLPGKPFWTGLYKWMFMGGPSSAISTAAFPNVLLYIEGVATSVPRSTTSWRVPANFNGGTLSSRVIKNAVPVSVVAASSRTNFKPTVFVDMDNVQAYLITSGVAGSWVVGDTLTFNADTLDVVYG